VEAVVNNIVRFREEYRRFESIDELMNLELIDGVLFSKIAGYLTVE
jgi:DNA uptake protein ComE-like DNA-binding protein